LAVVEATLVKGKEETRKSVCLPDGATYYDLLDALQVNSETVMVLRDGQPVPEDDRIGPGSIRILQVVSSG